MEFRPHKIQVKVTTGGGLDENRDPIPVKEDWSCPTPCHYETDGRDNIKTLPDGSFTVYPYVVWLDPIKEDMTSKFVRLFDQYGNVEVEAQIQKCINGQLRTKLYV